MPGFGYGHGFGASSAALLAIAGAIGPVNLFAPAIIGTPTDGTSVTLDLGIWAGSIDHFDAQVVDQLGNSILARQTVTQDSALVLNAVAGKTLTLRVWAV